jgi:hypothetical protein
MVIRGLKQRLDEVVNRLRERSPVWPLPIRFESIEVWPKEEERRWLDDEERVLPYLHWPNI